MGRVLIVPSRNMESPVTRIRGHGFAGELRRAGIECEVFPTRIPVRWGPGVDMLRPSLKDGARIVKAAAAMRPSDVVYVLRSEDIPGVGTLLPVLRRLGRFRLVFDFDDAVYETSPRSTAALCHAADHVVVTNPTLEAYARRFNDRVTIIPTPVETDLFPKKDWSVEHRPPIIGWAGTPSNLPLLKQVLEGPLQRLAQRTPFELRIVTWPLDRIRPFLPHLTRVIPWTLEGYRAEIARFDVGVSAVPSTPWTKGKMGFKLLEYMAAGVPAVGSRLFASGDLYEPGVSGYYAEGDEEWERALLRLLEDRTHARQVGDAGLRRCEERFSMKVAGRAVANVVNSLLS